MHNKTLLDQCFSQTFETEENWGVYNVKVFRFYWNPKNTGVVIEWPSRWSVYLYTKCGKVCLLKSVGLD